jgi:heme O synthase-like polyprenyltransferase
MTVMTRRQIAHMLAACAAVCAVLVILQAPVWTLYVAGLLIGWPWIISASSRRGTADASKPAKRPRVGVQR